MVEPEQTSIARQQLSKNIPAATNKHAITESLPFLCNGEVNTSVTIEELLVDGVFYVVRAEMLQG
jgi:hypothetical protein